MLQRPARPTRLILILLTVLAPALLTGCASSRLPPKLSPADQALVRGFQLPYTVGVVQDQHRQSRNLLEDLQASGIFRQVGLANQLASPDLLIESNRAVGIPYEGPQIPVWSLLSFGIVPLRVDEEHGQSFTLSTPGCNSSGVDVDFSYQGKFTGGWIALLINISTNYTVRNPRNTDRYQDGLALAIAERAQEIERLASQTACG